MVVLVVTHVLAVLPHDQHPPPPPKKKKKKLENVEGKEESAGN